MFGKEVMSNSEAFMISLTGLCIVFLTLIVIAIMIKLTSVVVNAVVKEGENAVKKSPEKAAPVVENKKDGALVAAIIAAVSEEMKLPVDQFKIVSIKEKN